MSHFCWSKGNRIMYKNVKKNPTRIDPDTEASPDKECPMRLACMYNNFETMVELAKYTEPDEEVKESSLWELVEKEQERR